MNTILLISLGYGIGYLVDNPNKRNKTIDTIIHALESFKAGMEEGLKQK